jgi:sRNA-binding regulator protein Hfq
MINPKLYQQFKNLSKEKINDAFLDNCAKGDIEILDYLLNSTELKYNATDFNKFGAILEAVQNRHINVVKYLVENNYLGENALSYIQNKFVLDAIRINEDIPMIQYLILELNIEKTKFMEDFLNYSNTDYRNTVAQLFNTRTLHNLLKDDLSDKNKTINKKTKI